MENKHKHLEMVQSVINRMASNSFLLKGWTVTLVAGVLALASKESEQLFFLVVFVPIIIFWGLDSYYLLQERLYRGLYDVIRTKSDNEIDFSMNANLSDLKYDKNTFWCCICSKTEVLFYFPLAIIVLGIICLVYFF